MLTHGGSVSEERRIVGLRTQAVRRHEREAALRAVSSG